MKISLKRFIPKHHNINSINFAEMQTKFTDSPWLKTPSVKQLLNSDDIILYRHQTASSCLTILHSGLVLASYQHADTKRNTIIPAQKDYCYYPIESGKPLRIPATDYAMMPFINALEMLLLFRIDKNANERERSRISHYVDASGDYHKKKDKTFIELKPLPRTLEDAVLDYLEPDTEPDYRTKCKIALSEEIKQLTDNQREAVQLYIHENLTQQEIADKLGISRTTVQGRLNGAVKKIKKICSI